MCRPAQKNLREFCCTTLRNASASSVNLVFYRAQSCIVHVADGTPEHINSWDTKRK